MSANANEFVCEPIDHDALPRPVMSDGGVNVVATATPNAATTALPSCTDVTDGATTDVEPPPLAPAAAATGATGSTPEYATSTPLESYPDEIPHEYVAGSPEPATFTYVDRCNVVLFWSSRTRSHPDGAA